MASSRPSLVTIPREIRDQIWELLYIKNFEQNPVPRSELLFRNARYPHMKAALYLTSQQLNQEHKGNLLREDKRIERTILVDHKLGLFFGKDMIQAHLQYPSLKSYVVDIAPYGPESIITVLKYAMFVAYAMRRQSLHRHRHMTVYVEARNQGLYLDERKRKRKRNDDAAKQSSNDIFDHVEEFRQESHPGQLCLKIDVIELSLLEAKGNLVEVLEVEKRTKLALNALRDPTEVDEAECDIP